MIKNELSGKIMTKLAALRLKIYSYLIDKCDEKKKSRRHKKVYKKKLKLNFKDYKKYLEATQL